MDRHARDLLELIRNKRIGATMIECRRDGTRQAHALARGSLYTNGGVGFGWYVSEGDLRNLVFAAANWTQDLKENVLFLARTAPDTGSLDLPHAEADLYLVVFVR